jgi:hypothetical protein
MKENDISGFFWKGAYENICYESNKKEPLNLSDQMGAYP